MNRRVFLLVIIYLVLSYAFFSGCKKDEISFYEKNPESEKPSHQLDGTWGLTNYFDTVLFFYVFPF